MDYFLFSVPSLAGCIIAVTSAVVLLICYRMALPRPIPGIPYNKTSANSILGDVPRMMKHVGETREILSWLTAQCLEHNSPIVQIFSHPFGRPTVVMCDFRESQDIMMRRLKKFDSSDFFSNLFHGVIPEGFICQPTNERHKNQRRLLGDTMNPTFLNEVAAPLIHDTVLDMVQVWRTKIGLAQGRPFEASEDIYRFALDAIWAATFATQIGTTASQNKLLSSLPYLSDLPKSKDEPVHFPKAPTPPAFDAIVTLTDSMGPMLSSPLPRLHHWLIRQMPGYRRALSIKNQFLTDHLNETKKKFHTAARSDSDVKYALDLLFQREQKVAIKEGREPVFDTPVTRDELLTFLIGGHETSSTTLTWAVKLLADYPHVTTTLRSILYTTLSPGSPPYSSPAPPTPSATQLSKANLPYLDAVVEEVLRVGGTAGAVSRKAIRDVEVLGHIIPKGTDIMMMNNGPSILSAPMDINEKKRSKTSQASEEKRGAWDISGVSEFQPERWLKSAGGESREVVFDPSAGPNAPFGFGTRGCFGKRLALLELKMTIAMIVWHFHLLKCPPDLSTYAAEDKITHHPRQCYVRLETI